MEPFDYPASYYAATAIDPPRFPAFSGEAQCEVCVIGGGYTGLSAALHLAERAYSVVLLEAARMGWGASGRNGGQVGTGLRLGPGDLVARFGRDDARRLWALGEEAKALVREHIDRHAIACEWRTGTLLAAVRHGHLKALARSVEILDRDFAYPHARLVPREEIPALVATEHYHGGILDMGAGHLHPLNYALGLARAAAGAGARLYENSPVAAVEGGARPIVRTATGVVRARHVVLACNGYLGRLEPRLAATILPLVSCMLATEPLGEERARALIPSGVAVSDTKYRVDYYRLSTDGRLLFGGGEAAPGREPRDLAAFVRRPMLRVFPQLADVGVDYAWGGQIAITSSRLPHFGRLGTSLLFAHGFSGHGVALATLAGKLLADVVAGRTERFDVLARLRHTRFPGGARVRGALVALALLYFGLRDRL